ncbi:methyltransferase, FxLD system, partial [Actinomadura adrarensis]
MIAFADWRNAEAIALEHLLPVLEAAHDGQESRCWSFVRKFPTWRLRWRPDSHGLERLDRTLETLLADGLIEEWTPGIYEPEAAAFGGTAAMEIAHALFHHDSRHVLQHLAQPGTPGSAPPMLGRRELAVLLPSVAMRAASMDWYEQGDVWAKVAEQRPAPHNFSASQRFAHAMHRLMTVDVGPASTVTSNDGPLAPLTGWIDAFAHAGRQLANLNRRGQLQRGVRAVLAHHVIFHWNRLGLSREDQAVLAALAKAEVMGTSGQRAVSASGATPHDTTVARVSSDTLPASADHLRNALVDQLIERGYIRTGRVEEAMRTVPRHAFVPHAPLE